MDARHAEIPVEQLTRFALAVNLKTEVGGTSLPMLLPEAEIREIVVLHHVALRLDSHLVGMLRLRFAAGGDEVVVANDLYPDESLLDVSVDCTTRLLGRSALANQPGAVL